jgi:hypothetical protein
MLKELNGTMDSLIISLLPKPKNLDISVIFIGALLIGFGFVFVAQSRSLLGPSSSFMYSNPDWTTNGSAVALVGIIVCSIGLLMRFVRKPPG